MLAIIAIYLVLLPMTPWLHSVGTSATRVAAVAVLGWHWPWVLPLWVLAFWLLNLNFPTRSML